jgi:hypothetical protein
MRAVSELAEQAVEAYSFAREAGYEPAAAETFARRALVAEHRLDEQLAAGLAFDARQAVEAARSAAVARKVAEGFECGRDDINESGGIAYY